ncbi:MAG: GMP/IMP nucleotidase [Sinobacteraceae bacterium]|nr:GMP/IMP nucleotidase [Nevskiaceae bacterium]
MTAQARVDWSRTEHVLLDMDGTVLDLAFDNYFWTELVPARYAQSAALPLAEARARLAPHFRELRGRLEWYCLDHWSRLTGLDLSALKAEVRGRIAPLPGAREFLDAVRISGRRLWLVTNAHGKSWRLKLEHTGLDAFFDRVICAHDFGCPKEDPAFWPALRARHPFEPNRALFVDDSVPVLENARHCDFGTLLAIRRPDSRQPPQVIENFLAVDSLVQLLPIE